MEEETQCDRLGFDYREPFLPFIGGRKASKDRLADAALPLGAATPLLMWVFVYRAQGRSATSVTDRLGRA
jgi:hypothetical protein